ncbi:MAG: ATP-binding protein [Muribaculaceae bacterium]|nr:ATP-binding protein [Muribaculaceae bacterium]
MSRTIKYPVDTANFQKIRDKGYVYVDKTEYIHKLTDKGTYYFLARPRRFGKSLFLDTMAEYFKGNRELLKGLAIDRLQPEEWEKYPVLRFNLSGVAYNEKNILNSTLTSALVAYERNYGIEVKADSLYTHFLQLIEEIYKTEGKKVVILIDEYDAPLTSAIGKPELQEIYREELHGFYSVLKKAEVYIQFCFLTGVTRYGKVSVFSGLNNLNDITFDDRYAGICGITSEELHKYYDEGVEAISLENNTSKEEIYANLRFHYDGYHFSSSMLDIYNPFSINHFFDRKEFSDYWCRSGVPTILSKSLLENDYDLEKLIDVKVKEESISNLSIQNMQPVPLFYQTGYLTLKGYDPRRKLYTLGYPNREVEDGIINNILNYYTGDKKNDDALIYDLQDALTDGEPLKFIEILSSFLSSIPNQLHKYVGNYENYYHTIFYCITKLLGLDVEAEYSTSEGFIDILIKTDKYIYIIELKLNGGAEDAMRQIEERHYAAPFATDSRTLIKIAIGFSKETHTISSYLVEG